MTWQVLGRIGQKCVATLIRANVVRLASMLRFGHGRETTHQHAAYRVFVISLFVDVFHWFSLSVLDDECRVFCSVRPIDDDFRGLQVTHVETGLQSFCPGFAPVQPCHRMAMGAEMGQVAERTELRHPGGGSGCI